MVWETSQEKELMHMIKGKQFKRVKKDIWV